MSSSPGGQGPPQRNKKPPYAPRMASLGGLPEVRPDVPITVTYLFLFIVFAIIHFKILKTNQKRDHKFLFSGALFGFCKVRVITMSLRIAWACYPHNISLGIAATIFVYVGTIILYIVNWFFTQRIIRAQHATWGWSKPYRVLHRVALGCLVACLLMLVVAAVQQFFTANPKVLRIDRTLQLIGQTYFSVFVFAPVILLAASLVIPRKGTEKFGLGRMRNNIIILLIGASILSMGQIFRCVTLWLPPVPLRGARGPQEPPWYFSRACFYVFNFSTEIAVIMFYAAVRVDLRFHVLDGSNGPRDYAKGRRESMHRMSVIAEEKKLKRASMLGVDTTKPVNSSNDTLHEYEDSIFDDTRTLADSLRYPSSVLEVDSKTGHWKIKRVPSMYSDRGPHGSDPSLWSPDREAWVRIDAPPVPELPPNWPLRESQMPRNSVPVLEHQNRSSRGQSISDSAELPGHDMNRVDMSSAIAEAISKLEANSETRPRGRKEGSPTGDTNRTTDQPQKKGSTSGTSTPRRNRYYSSSSIVVPTSSAPPTPSSELPKPEPQKYKHKHSSSAPTVPKPTYSANPREHDKRSSLQITRHSETTIISSPISMTPSSYLRLTEPAGLSSSLPSSSSGGSDNTETHAATEFARFSDEALQRREDGAAGGGQEESVKSGKQPAKWY